MPAASAAPAAAVASAAPAEDEEPAAEVHRPSAYHVYVHPSHWPLFSTQKPKEKTIFTLRLESFDAAAKAKVIREVKSIVPNMNLMEAKKFAESVPQVLKENVPKEEAEKLKAAFEALGAKIVME